MTDEVDDESLERDFADYSPSNAKEDFKNKSPEFLH